MGKIVVFSPHPDDETLGCGGTIIKKVSEDFEVTIVVMTDGRYAFSKIFGIDSNPTPEELKQIRREEFARATKILGVPEENSLFLDFVDGTLKDHITEAEEKIVEILRKRAPTEVYFPYENDYNIDHQVTNKIVRNCIKKTGFSTLEYQYSITQKYSRVGPIVARWFARAFKHNLIQVDISKFLPWKRAAVNEFKSQLTIISKRQKRPVIPSVKRFLRNKEIFFVS